MDDQTIVADIFMAVASVIFTGALIPQIYRIQHRRTAQDVSWMFLLSVMSAIILYVTGKFLAHCYTAASLDIIGLLGYCVLIIQKIHFDGSGPHGGAA